MPTALKQALDRYHVPMSEDFNALGRLDLCYCFTIIALHQNGLSPLLIQKPYGLLLVYHEFGWKYSSPMIILFGKCYDSDVELI